MSLPAGECVRARAGVGINWRGRGTKFQLCAALGLKQKRADAAVSVHSANSFSAALAPVSQPVIQPARPGREGVARTISEMMPLQVVMSTELKALTRRRQRHGLHAEGVPAGDQETGASPTDVR